MTLKKIIVALLVSTCSLLLSACNQSPHGSSTISLNTGSGYNSYTNGPSYSPIQLSDTSNAAISITALSMDNNGPSAIVTSSNPNYSKVYGTLTACSVGLVLNPGQSCYVMVNANLTSPKLFTAGNPGASLQKLTLNTNISNNIIDITTQGYLYLGGNFTTLGGAGNNVNPMIAKCGYAQNAWSCQDIGDITAGTIYTMTHDSAGNIYIGGNFSTIKSGIRTAVTTSPYDPSPSISNSYALLAKYNPLNSQPFSNAFAVNSSSYDPLWSGSGVTAAITAITMDSNNYLYITGALNNIGGTSITTDPAHSLLAKCDLSQSSNQCNIANAAGNVLQYASSPYIDMNYANTLTVYTDPNGQSSLLIGGDMSGVGGSSAPYSDACPLNQYGLATSCSAFGTALGSGTDPIVFSMTIDNSNASQPIVYVGGLFTRFNSYPSPASTGPFLGNCPLVNGNCTSTTNGIGTAGSGVYVTGGIGDYNNGTIAATALDYNGNVFIAGQFNTITDGTPLASVSGQNLIALCKLNGGANPSCSSLFPTNNSANKDIDTMITNAEITATTVEGS